MADTNTEIDSANDSEEDPWATSASEENAASESPPSWKKLLRLIGFLVIIVTLVALGVQQLTNKALENKLVSETRAKQPGKKPQGFERNPDTSSDKPPANVISTREAVRRSRVLEAQSDIQAAQELLGRLVEEQSDWQQYVAAVTAGEVGRRIAADDKAVELFSAAMLHNRITAAETVRLRQFLFTLAKPIELAAADESATLVIETEFTEQIRDIRTKLEVGLRQWRDDNAVVRLLASEAKSREPAKATLAEAIDRLRASQLRQRAERIASELKASEESLAEQEAASKIELQELESQKRLELDKVQAERKKAELAGLRAEQIALADQIAAAREKAKLELAFQAALPEIRSVLVPFTAEGHKQLVNGKWTYLEEKQPLSLSGLKSIAVLDGDNLSLQRLFFVGGGRKNDRPNGPFPNYIGGHIHDNNMPLARKVQRLLNTFGELMVEKGMLKP